MSYYEGFQSNESDINSAYSNADIDIKSYGLPYCDSVNSANSVNSDNSANSANSANSVNNDSGTSTIRNLWDFLGISKSSKKEKECLFDCSIEGTGCLTECDSSNSKKCNYECLNKGLKCTKKCILGEKCIDTPTSTFQIQNVSNNDQTIPVNHPTTNSIPNITHSSAPKGNKPFFSNYAPVDSNYWPSHTQVGWDVDEIDPQNNNTIEVLMYDYHSVKTPEPNLLF
tara:strand:- start:3026 stop:3706 length:681 start_codon:yes stop_codon:yes gene_type:complete